MTYTAPQPEAIAAYRLDITYRFGVTLRRFQDGDFQEFCSEVVTDSPMFVSVCQAVRRQHPGWSIHESWEIASSQPDDDGPTLEQLFDQFEAVYQRSA